MLKWYNHYGSHIYIFVQEKKLNLDPIEYNEDWSIKINSVKSSISSWQDIKSYYSATFKILGFLEIHKIPWSRQTLKV